MAFVETCLGIVGIAIGTCALGLAIRTNRREKWALWATAVLVAIAAFTLGPVLLWMAWQDDLRNSPLNI